MSQNGQNVNEKRKKSNKFCSVPRCSTYWSPETCMHLFPKCEKLRNKWMEALNIKKPIRCMYVCTLHFTKNDYILPDIPSQRKRLKKGAVPSLNLTVGTVDKNKGLRRSCVYKPRRSQEDKETVATAEALLCLKSSSKPMTSHQFTIDTKSVCTKAIQTDSSMFEEKVRFSDMLKNDFDVFVYTGVQTVNLLKSIVAAAQVADSTITGDKIILTLTKLNLNMTFNALAALFDISIVICKTYFHTTILILSAVLRNLIVWFPRDKLSNNLPACFSQFPNLSVILDCFYVNLEKSNCLKCRIRSHSECKGCQSAKYLIATAPNGGIMSLSTGYTGLMSEKQMIKLSNVMSHLKPGDAAIVNDNFMTDDFFKESGVQFINLPSMKGKSDSVINSADEIRSHIQKVTQSIKKFKILNNSKYCSSLIPYVNHIMTIICGLVNLNNLKDTIK